MRPKWRIDQLKPGELLTELGELIRESREIRMITVTRLARDTGISRGTLLSIEKGSGSVSIGSYFTVMYHLGFINRMNDVVNLTRFLV